MSKAFTKEPDGDDDLDRAPEAALPGGFTNYITPAGHKRLNDELSRLWKVDRPKLVETIAWAASNGDRSKGVHNPGLSTKLLGASILALQEVYGLGVHVSPKTQARLDRLRMQLHVRALRTISSR